MKNRTPRPNTNTIHPVNRSTCDPVTSPEAVELARDFLVAAGQAPIVMKREIDGFVMNRMQDALLEEAFRLVADGYATAEDIDVKYP